MVTGVLGAASTTPASLTMSSCEADTHGMPSVVRIAEENLGEALRHDGAKAVLGERLRGVLTRRAAAEVRVREEDARPGEARLVERMRLFRAVLLETHVVKQVLAQPVEGHTLHEARRDDAIRVDVVAGQVEGGAVDFFDFCECHGS